jgi:16S rRNA (uracil1498-N3)-methyltransferase
MPPRFFSPQDLSTDALIELDPVAARHVQVLRLQPGLPVTLFNGKGGEYSAEVTDMGRSRVSVRILAHHAIERELPTAIHLQMGVPANERMDWLVEKATELGVSSIQPLITERTVLRLSGERAEKRVAHWQAIAQAACEQCGRNRVPKILPLQTWGNFSKTLGHSSPQAPVRALILSLSEQAQTFDALKALNAAEWRTPVNVLSGPEGGLSPAEEATAIAAGYWPASLGARTLRAETAALAALIALSS